MRLKVGAVLLCALAFAGPAYAETSEEDIMRMFIPAEISLIRDNGKYTFQSALAVPFYTFDRDEPNKSNCTGKCAETWWPVRTKGQSTPMVPWTLVARDDGRAQLAYKGQPIYYYVDDKVGEKFGDGIDGEWHVLEP
jgi:predicted lipoprotein with Yx(FWY)xxD motif